MDKKYYVFEKRGKTQTARLEATKTQAFSQAYQAARKTVAFIFPEESPEDSVKRIKYRIERLKKIGTPVAVLNTEKRSLGWAHLGRIKGIDAARSLFFKRALRSRVELA